MMDGVFFFLVKRNINGQIFRFDTFLKDFYLFITYVTASENEIRFQIK